jgi:hypothetical protein
MIWMQFFCIEPCRASVFYIYTPLSRITEDSMRVLINNTVKTDNADYVFRTREEAETFYLTLKGGLGLSDRDDNPDDSGTSLHAPERDDV